MAPQLSSSSQKGIVFLVLVGVTATILLLSLNFIIIWNFGRELPEGTSIFYWQQFLRQYLDLQCLTLVFVPVITIIWAGIGLRWLKNRRVGIALLAILFLYGACLFINYLGFFAFRWLEPAGSVRLKNHTYQLARVIEYDNGTDYYLGECMHASYECVFHKIYRTHALVTHLPKIELDNDYLIIKLNDEIIYTYDGTQEYCIRTEAGWCIEDS